LRQIEAEFSGTEMDGLQMTPLDFHQRLLGESQAQS
jgi:hypothetical protein